MNNKKFLFAGILLVTCVSLNIGSAENHSGNTCRKDNESQPVLYKDASLPIETRVEDLISRMTLEEKIYQLNQYILGTSDNENNNVDEAIENIPGEIGSLNYTGEDASVRNAMQKRAMEDTRLGIPILFGYDVIHGFRTIYPIPLAQAASWNPELAGEACRVAATEAYAAGVDWTFSPMVDIARDPRWGRIAEGYGEDPYLASVFGAATVKGYQGDDLSKENNIAACLKHFVGYGASEAGRDYVPTDISRQALWDTYLPPFEAGVKAGAATLMSSFNTISGIPATANRYTMTDIVKNRWNHQGFIVADWTAVEQLINQGLAANKKEAACLALNAGVDMDMIDWCYQELPELIAEGKISMERLNDAVKRILRVKFMLGLFEKPYIEEKPYDEIYLQPSSLETAEKLAQESMVLLENDGVLPLKNVNKVALIGPLAKDQYELLGSWCARGKKEDVISIFDGLSEELSGKAEIIYAQGCDFDGDDTTGFAEAVSAATKSDIVILCLGEKRLWSGENSPRSTIALPDIQEELLKAVTRAGKPVAVLLSNGRPLDLSRISPLADAVLEIWQPGLMAGHAVAGILTGKYNPSGKLPVTFPYTTGQIPIYYKHRKSGRGEPLGFYLDIQSTPMYEFGYGLSYTEYEYGEIKVSSSTFSSDDKIKATVSVRNSGKMDGMETVQWYICDPFCSITRPVKELKHFEKKIIPAGATETFTFEIDPERDLSFVDSEGKKFLEAGDYYIIVKDHKIKITLK